MKLYSIKKMVLSVIAVFLVLGSSITLNATHIVGGDLTYKCLGNNEYEITLTMRRDCYNGSEEAAFDDPASIGIYRASDGWFMKGLGDFGSGVIKIPLSFNDTLNETLTSECGFVGEQVCVETTTYRKTVTLPFLTGGYTLAYQRCCRNVSLSNILDPIETGSAYTVDISETAMQTCNSSPTFNDWGSIYICKDQDLVFDHSATDPDGDELVYSLCMPHTSLSIDNPIANQPSDFVNNAPPYDEIEWIAPYSLANMMGGTPLEIDPNTGVITATPNLVGQFLIGVCVEEFRNGVSIGKTIRDFEYNVRICSEAPTADFSFSETECGSLEVDFTNNSSGADSYEWLFEYPNAEPNSTEVNPTHTYAEGGTYQVALTAIRDEDGCSVQVIKDIEVAGEGVEAAFEASVLECSTEGIILHMDDTSVSAGTYDRNWTVTQGGDTYNSTEDVWDTFLQNEEDVTIQLIVGSANCADTLTQTLTSAELLPQVDVDINIIECLEDSIVVEINGTFTTPEGVELTSSEWEITSTSGVSQNLTDATSTTITIPTTDNLTVTIIVVADNGCTKIYNQELNPNEVAIDLVIDDPYVLCAGESTTIIANPNSDWTYTWDPITGLDFGSTTDFSNPTASPTETTTYNVTVTDGVCTETTQVTVEVMENSEFTIEGETVYCDGNEIELWVAGDTGGREFEWSTDPNFGTILMTGDTLKTTIGVASETYYARVKDGGECASNVASTTVTMEETPILDFTYELECGTYTVCFTSTGGLTDDEANWDNGDGTSSNGTSPCNTYTTPGDYIVVLSDVSENCPGEAVTKTITVPEILDITVEQDEYVICAGESITINTSSTVGDANITYYDADGNVIGTNADGTLVLSPTESGIITAVVSDEYGCEVSHDIDVTVNNFDGDVTLELTPEQTGYAGQEYELAVTGGLEGYTYLWDTGETTATINVNPTETTTYCVTITDNNGCTNILCETITIDQEVLCNEEDIYLPTAFSPNGDDHNDVYYVRSNVISSMELVVFNRWGEQIFLSKNINDGWDGTFKGAALSPDVYAYCIRAICIDSTEKVIVGNVSLLK